METLAQALTLGCRLGYVRVFADEGPPMAALLARLVAAQKAEQAAAHGVPLAAWPSCCGHSAAQTPRLAPGQDAAPAVPELIEQLTARELDVLRLLAAGAPNPRIAKELVVSLDTVKKHVSHLLAKLGAANRTEAVSQARELGLIPYSRLRGLHLSGADDQGPRDAVVVAVDRSKTLWLLRLDGDPRTAI